MPGASSGDLPPAGTGFDWDGFDTFLCVLDNHQNAESTREDLYRCLRRMIRRGFDPEMVENEEVTGTFLKMQARHGPSEYKKNVQVANAILRWRKSRLKYPYPKRQRSVPKRYTPRELALLKAYRHPNPLVALRNKALIAFALGTGMRRSEVARFRASHLDVDEGTIRIDKPAKNGLIRTIPVDPDLLKPRSPFMVWLQARPSSNDADGVWLNLTNGQQAEVMQTAKVGQMMTKIGNECGVRANFIRSRHTRATELLQRGIHVRYVQFYLGHADLKATMVYMEADEHDLKREFDRVRRRKR